MGKREDTPAKHLFPKTISRYHLFLVLGALTVVFLLFTLYTAFQNQQKQQEINTRFAVAQDNFTEGAELISQDDIPQARKFLARALDETEDILAIASDHEQTRELRENITLRLDQIDGVIRIADLSPTLDFTELDEEVRDITTMQLVNGTLYVLETKIPRLYSYNVENENSRTIVEDFPQQAENTMALASIENNLYFYGNDKIVNQFNTETEQFQRMEVDFGESWRDADNLYSYASNLYLLDIGRDQIWRYSLTSEVFSPPSRYFNTTNVSLNGTIDIAIDGDIYLLKKDGQLIRNTSTSKPDPNFTVTNVKPELENPTAIYTTTSDDAYLYIAEPQKNRIIAINKNGQFQEQFLWENESIDTISDIILDTANNTLHFLGDNKLYTISLAMQQ
jgi:hypothetical protein